MTNDDFTTGNEAVEAMAMPGDENLEAIAAHGADISTVQEETGDERGLEPGGGEDRLEPGKGTDEILTAGGNGPAEGGGDTETDPGGESEEGGVRGDDGDNAAAGEDSPAEPQGAQESQEEEPEKGQEDTQEAEGIDIVLAVKKLEGWKKGDKHPYCQLICAHLIKRCREDAGFAQDVLQEAKTWGNCFSFTTKNARKMASGSCAAVEDYVVYEWAEDYIRGVETQVKKPAEAAPETTENGAKKPKSVKKTTKTAAKPAKTDAKPQKTEKKPQEEPAPATPDPEHQEPKPEPGKPKGEAEAKAPKPGKPKKEKKPEKKPKDAGMDGQLDLFSLFG